MEKKLATAQYSYQPNSVPGISIVSFVSGTHKNYHEIIELTRHYYRKDTIAGTVINRMADIAITPLKNKHRKVPKEVQLYYDAVASILTPMLKTIPLMYLIDGMAIPEYRTERVMGNRIDDRLGRTRYVIPKAVWVRDNANIELKKNPLGDRSVYLKISYLDQQFIRDEGKPDREQEYKELVQLYPQYVESVKNGVTKFRLYNVNPIYRKLTPYNDYPIPFLENALESLAFRRKLKDMDKITSDRVINALRHISVGNDEYPADDDDIAATKKAIEAQTNQETLLNVYTNHTVKINWIIPDISALLDERKYTEANADVFLALGFPRLWAVGENEKSNTSDNKLASVGPISTLESLRNDMLVWIRQLYAHLAELNDFLVYPEPYFSPISIAEMKDLLQYAVQFVEKDIISKDTASRLFGTSFNDEIMQIERESNIEIGMQHDNTIPESNNNDTNNRAP